MCRQCLAFKCQAHAEKTAIDLGGKFLQHPVFIWKTLQSTSDT